MDIQDEPIPGYDDGLTERDPTPPEYDDFKGWFYEVYPEGEQILYQRLYRAFQAGYHTHGQQEQRQPQ